MTAPEQERHERVVRALERVWHRYPGPMRGLQKLLRQAQENQPSEPQVALESESDLR